MPEKTNDPSTQIQDLDAADVNDNLSNPYMPTAQDCILTVIGLLLMLHRRSAIPILPVQLGLIWGFFPPDCLLWTFLIAKFAVRDILHVYRRWDGTTTVED